MDVVLVGVTLWVTRQYITKVLGFMSIMASEAWKHQYVMFPIDHTAHDRSVFMEISEGQGGLGLACYTSLAL